MDTWVAFLDHYSVLDLGIEHSILDPACVHHCFAHDLESPCPDVVEDKQVDHIGTVVPVGQSILIEFD